MKNIESKELVKKGFQKGLDFYNRELFDENLIPKYTHKSLYPIDIQSLAQAVITYAVISEDMNEYLDKAKKIADWTIANLYDSEGYFYYRVYKNGSVDKTPYIRWAQSWMLRAVSLIIKVDSV